MRRYKTLNGLLNAISNKTFTFNMYLSKRASFVGRGFDSFALSDELNDEICNIFASSVYERGAKSKVNKFKNYRGKSYGIFDGLIIQKLSNGKLHAQFYAGQDYIEAIKTIKQILNS